MHAQRTINSCKNLKVRDIDLEKIFLRFGEIEKKEHRLLVSK